MDRKAPGARLMESLRILDFGLFELIELRIGIG